MTPKLLRISATIARSALHFYATDWLFTGVTIGTPANPTAFRHA
jgi:hypothetical protein